MAAKIPCLIVCKVENRKYSSIKFYYLTHMKYLKWFLPTYRLTIIIKYTLILQRKMEMELPVTCLYRSHACTLTCTMQTGRKQKSKKVTMRKVVGKNLKLYCTTLCQRSNGLTSQLLAKGTMGEQRQERDRTRVSETRQNTKDCHD